MKDEREREEWKRIALEEESNSGVTQKRNDLMVRSIRKLKR